MRGTRGPYGGLGRIDIAEAIQNDIGALSGQLLSNAQTDSAG